MPNIAPTPDKMLANLGPLVEETVTYASQTFRIRHPQSNDHLLDHPAVRSAFMVDEYMPYWTEIWPAARMLAKVLLQEQWPAPTQTLEIGCGLGLAGLAALSLGHQVVFSDYDATALQFAADNARLNGYHDFTLLQMDWRQPTANYRVPLLLIADLIYESRNVEPLVQLIRQMLLPDGICLLTDQDRQPAGLLRSTLAEYDLAFTSEAVYATDAHQNRLKGTLYRIKLTR